MLKTFEAAKWVKHSPPLSNSKEKAYAVPDAQPTNNPPFVQSLNSKRVDLSRFATAAIADRFWAQVHKTDHCWIWKGSTRKGYGKFHPVRGVTVSAPRFAYFLQYGVDPGQAYVCHQCDQALCCRPSDLFLGTPLENMEDKKAKGRSKFGRHQGEGNAMALLSAADVEAIRKRITAGETNTAIARDYVVSHHAISRIRLGKAWTGPRRRTDINTVQFPQG